MAFSRATGSFLTGTGAIGTTITVTTTDPDTGDFQPKAVILWWIGRTDATDAAGNANMRRGFGVFTSATDRRCIVETSNTGAAAGNSSTYIHDAACIVNVPPITSAIDGILDVDAILTNGFRLIVEDVMPADVRVFYLALGGDDLTNAETGIWTGPTATGDQDITTVGFQPDCLIIFSECNTVNPPDGQGDESRMMISFVDDAGNAVVWAGGTDVGSASMDTSSYCRGGECMANLSHSDLFVMFNRATFVSYLSNGFRINWAKAADLNEKHQFLALKGLKTQVGNLLTQTDTTTDIVESGFGFSPKATLFLSANRAENTAEAPSGHDNYSLGCALSATSRSAVFSLDEDNLANSEVSTAHEFDAVYGQLDGTPAVVGLMDYKSTDSDGFTCIMDDADPSQAFVGYLSFAEAEAAGEGQPTTKRWQGIPHQGGVRGFARGSRSI